MQHTESIEEAIMYIGEIMIPKGYNWKQQLIGYLLKNDPTYLSPVCRKRASSHEQDDYIEWLLSVYLESEPDDPSYPNSQTELNTIARAAKALKEKGYDAQKQLSGFIISSDPSYITTHNQARDLVKKYGSEDYLQALLEYATSNSDLKRLQPLEKEQRQKDEERHRKDEEEQRQKEKAERIAWLKEQIGISEDRIKQLGLFKKKEKDNIREMIRKYQDELNELM